MKIWTLYEESNIKGKTKPDYYTSSRGFRTFGKFEDAKAAMREAIKSYAAVNGELFDGNGNFRNIADDITEELTEDGCDPKEIEEIIGIVHDFFMGEDVAKRALAAAEVADDGEVYFSFGGCGIELCDAHSKPYTNPENDIDDPYMPMWEEAWDTVETNALVMNDPSLKFVCRVHTAFSGEDADPPAFFQIELVMTEVE